MNARDWKTFILAWVLVALCALPAIAWGQPVLQVGKNDGNIYSTPSCSTLEQIKDVMSQNTAQGVREWLARYNRIKDSTGEPACGRVEAQIVVLRIVSTHTVDGMTVHVILFQPEGYPTPLYGITTLEVKDGQRT